MRWATLVGPLIGKALRSYSVVDQGEAVVHDTKHDENGNQLIFHRVLACDEKIAL